MRSSEDKADVVSALQRGFELLDCIAAARRPLSLADLAGLTGIPKPTLLRLLHTLLGLGHVRMAREGQGYELDAGVVRLAEAFLGASDVRQRARPHLVALAEACQASAFLAVRDAQDMLVVEAARSRSAVLLMGADVGTRMPLATSALGRAWLSGVDPATRAAVRAGLDARPAALPLRTRRALDLALDEAIRQGHALSLGEYHPNIHAVAVPVRTPGGEVLALNCGGPSFLLPREQLLRRVLPRLQRAAEDLARDIGGQAGVALMRTHAPKTDAAAPATPPARTRRRRSTDEETA